MKSFAVFVAVLGVLAVAGCDDPPSLGPLYDYDYQQIPVVPAPAAPAPAPDDTAPTVTVFTLAAPASGLVVTITALTAADDVGVTGYLVNESAAKPPVAAAGWATAKPTTVTASASGARTFYAWARDAAGNVSEGKGATVTVP